MSTEPYTYEEALAVARVAAQLQRHDVPCPGGAVAELLARIEKLENTSPGDVLRRRVTKEDLWVEAWMSARLIYGTQDEVDDGERYHGAECDRVQGPYECTCNVEAQRELAKSDFHWRYGG